MELNRLTMTGLRAIETGKGIAWDGILCIDGAPRIRVSNLGDGGCNRYMPIDGDFKAARSLQAELETAAAQAIGDEHEALGSITSAMDNGDSGADGAHLWLAA